MGWDKSNQLVDAVRVLTKEFKGFVAVNHVT
jgi:hypothetical protein